MASNVIKRQSEITLLPLSDCVSLALKLADSLWVAKRLHQSTYFKIDHSWPHTSRLSEWLTKLSLSFSLSLFLAHREVLKVWRRRAREENPSVEWRLDSFFAFHRQSLLFVLTDSSDPCIRSPQKHAIRQFIGERERIKVSLTTFLSLPLSLLLLCANSSFASTFNFLAASMSPGPWLMVDNSNSNSISNCNFQMSPCPNVR